MDSKCTSDSSEHIKEALSILGDKWSALILRLLHKGPLRFSQIIEQLEGISSRTLTKRLDMMIEKCIIHKAPLENTPHQIYELTQKGQDLDEVIHSMAQWGKQHS